jgi:hypothetical protein
VRTKPFVFDKVAWHLEEVRQRGLADAQAGVHIGLAFAWLVDQGFVQEWLRNAEPQAFAAYRHGHLTGRELLQRLGGALVDDMLTDEGLAFALHYLDPRVGEYLDDYRERIVADRASDYHVPDDEASASRVAALLAERHAAWRPGYQGGRPDAWAIRGVDRPPELPERLPTAPVLPVGAGAPLPGGALSARLRTPGAVGAVRDALASDLIVVLVPDEADDVGVVGWIEEARDEGEGVFLVGMRCLARCARHPDDGGWVVHRDGEPSPSEAEAIEQVRSKALQVVGDRRRRGEPLGLLALAPALGGGALLDLVARALPLAPDEQLMVLEAFDLGLRAEQLQISLARHAV